VTLLVNFTLVCRTLTVLKLTTFSVSSRDIDDDDDDEAGGGRGGSQ